MKSSSTILAKMQVKKRESGRKTDPRRSVPGDATSCRHGLEDATRSIERPVRAIPTGQSPAVARQSGQLPAFAPLLEELEIAGWSSRRPTPSGNFHDWLLLENRGLLVMVGQTAAPAPADSTEAALVSQAAWAAIRAHAHHVRDAGMLLSLAARSLWPIPNTGLQASVAVALIDTAEGLASVAMAGDCLAWKVRATAVEPLVIRQPALGEVADFTYVGQPLHLSLRERLLLVADDPHQRSPKLAASIAASFARLDAESHRRMLAPDAVALVRRHYEDDSDELPPPASIVAVRRR